LLNFGRENSVTDKANHSRQNNKVHRASKNVPPLACYNFDAHEWILIFFGRNVTDKVGNQKRFTVPPQITCASALPGKMQKHENYIFHSIGLCYTKKKNCYLWCAW